MMITDTALADRYYQALLERDPAYTGIFWVGVKTTSVFCIATCRARKPRRENVAFYTTLKEALAAGYRPCKICQPTTHAHAAPPQVEAAIRLVRSRPKDRIADGQLREAGISPETVRRWFLRHYGMTFQAYQRMCRINVAVEELKSGRATAETALDAGYDSLSGFAYTYKKLTGGTPVDNQATRLIVLHRFTTPLGPMFAAATDEGLCLLEFTDRRMLETEFRDLQRLLGARIIAGENRHTRQTVQEIGDYFAGTRTTFGVALHTPGSAFRQAVWSALMTIPCGETASYAEQALCIGRPEAVRAVASANGHNRVSIIIPCHRVIGKDGALTGYGGGLERKRWLLAHERAMTAGDRGETDLFPPER